MKTYKEHYEECRKAYTKKTTADLNSVSFHLNCVENIPRELVATIDEKVLEKIEKNIDISHTSWTRHVSAWQDIEELEELCQIVMPQIEEKYFGCHLKVEHLHIYENKKNISLESSWVWHYDDCPSQFVKFAIYLNDVTAESGCMQIIEEDGEIPVIESYRDSPQSKKGIPPPVFPKSRIPKSFVKTLLKTEGAKTMDVSGPRGTHFLFTPNIIHRGTEPTPGSSPRRAIFFFIRPCLKKQERYSDSPHPECSKINVKKYELD